MNQQLLVTQLQPIFDLEQTQLLKEIEGINSNLPT